MWISSASSEGAMTIMLGSVAMYVTSNAPQCVAPSAPTRPPRSMAKRTARRTGQLAPRSGLCVHAFLLDRSKRTRSCDYALQVDAIFYMVLMSGLEKVPSCCYGTAEH